MCDFGCKSSLTAGKTRRIKGTEMRTQAEQDHEMRQLLAEMSVISEAPAAHFHEIVHGGESDRSPSGPTKSLGEWFSDCYDQAHDDDERDSVLWRSRRALILARKAPRREHVPGTLDWKLAILKAEGTVDEVSVVYGASRQAVYRIRAEFGSIAA